MYFMGNNFYVSEPLTYRLYLPSKDPIQAVSPTEFPRTSPLTVLGRYIQDWEARAEP